MTKTVVLVGAMDTKGADFAFVRDAIRGAGLNVLVVDFGVLGEPGLAPDVSRGDVAPYAGTKDITFMPSVIDVAGLNRISRLVYRNAAGAIAGMVAGQKPPPYPPPEEEGKSKPLIAATMFGNTTAAVDRARNQLERSGFEVLVFHVTGIGGRTMEDLVNDGQFQGVLDLTTTELADEVCGGVR